MLWHFSQQETATLWNVSSCHMNNYLLFSVFHEPCYKAQNFRAFEVINIEVLSGSTESSQLQHFVHMI